MVMFQPECLPILIGSFPLQKHDEAVKLIFKHTPKIPLWPQLPKLYGEGMIRQYLSGFPGLQEDGKRFWVDTTSHSFEEEMTLFYQDYLQLEEDPTQLQYSRFALDNNTAAGFSAFVNVLESGEYSPVAVKGQVTGPVTTGIGLKDHNGRSIFYDDNLRDMLVKLLSLKGRFQVEALQQYTTTKPIIFIDEPGIVSFGSTGFMGVTREMVSEAVAEVISVIQESNGMAGVHICANGDWGPVLSSSADIISFDAYYYFDNFILYRDNLSAFLKRGGMLAWGIVPTADPEIVQQENAESLFGKWREQLHELSTFGMAETQLMEQTFIAPSCGTGSLSPELAEKVLHLSAEVSRLARAYYNQLK